MKPPRFRKQPAQYPGRFEVETIQPNGAEKRRTYPTLQGSNAAWMQLCKLQPTYEHGLHDLQQQYTIKSYQDGEIVLNPGGLK